MLEKIIEYLIAPTVVGIVVIIAQFFIQPQIQRKITAQSELWLKKMKVYIKTIELIDKRFDSMYFEDSEPIVESPTTQEINEVFRELLLLCDDDEIIIRFQKFMDTSVEDYCSPANRGAYIKLLRNNLGKSKLLIDDEKIPYFRVHSKK